MLDGAACFAREFGANAPVVCCNGGCVQEMDAEEPLFARYFPQDVAERLLAFCYARDWYVNWYVGRETLAPFFDEKYFFAYRTVEGFHAHPVGGDYQSHTKNVIQCVVREPGGQVQPMVEAILEHFGGEVFVQQNTGTSADLTPPGVTKALGLSFLMERYGLVPENVMACGDGDNDIPMLKLAGTAVVPENGLPEAKALATYHALSNDEDGIARAIEELVLGA